MGRFTGDEVVAKHQEALRKCKTASGWELLKCIVNSMQEVYGKRGIAAL